MCNGTSEVRANARPGMTESFNAVGAGWLRSRGQGERENFKFAVPGWPANRPRMNNGRIRIPLFRSRAAARVESGASQKKDATGWLPSRPNFHNSLVQALRRPVAKL
ncbi:hypothetical protein SAMN05443248_5312 [Bradyrhizobium erythrophlei]|jgi:hypothetical protein|uniref:Uncharacterized protein n=1 Tax=Bradyrhizobium erythrophlei TaxID=1437360 RepID=A0A1M5U777_9BRAD|nr:hypothetical protein SAMN05443248_5312 [Bradyrhizobium erythrophlei]